MALTTVPPAGSKLRGSVLLALLTEVRPVVARKTADETVNNSSALQNDDVLAAAVVASATYTFLLVVHHNSNATADIKFGWTVPTGTTMVWGDVIVNTAGSLTVAANLTQSSVQAIGGTAGDSFQAFRGVIIVSTTAGTVQLQWAQNTADVSNTKVLAGSYLILTRIS